jgi:hypothetical protein
MKKPRVSDFDPNATITLASPLDGMPEIRAATRVAPTDKEPFHVSDDDQPLDPPENRSTQQSIPQSIDQSIDHSIQRIPDRVLEKPKAFYITAAIDKRIDYAVRYLKETHGIKKVDRSIVVTALLDNDIYWTEESLDYLVDPVIRHLTNRLTGK